MIGAMVDACTWAATEHGCDVDLEVIEMFRGYRSDPGSEPVRLALAAIGAAGSRRASPPPAAAATPTP